MQRMLRLKHNLPFYLEARLINRFGYHVQRRQFQEYVLFARTDVFNGKLKKFDRQVPSVSNDKNTKKKLILPSEEATLQKFGFPSLSKMQELDKRCDRIVSGFKNPYDHVAQIHQRFAIMKQGLPEAEQAYINDFLDEHFPHEKAKA